MQRFCCKLNFGHGPATVIALISRGVLIANLVAPKPLQQNRRNAIFASRN